MTPEERRIVYATMEWIETAGRNNYPKKLGRDYMTTADADHSALLKRLLEGKKPYPLVPPLAFSYPWYDLMENGWAVTSEVYGPKEVKIFPPTIEMYVCHSTWYVLQQNGQDDYNVRYSPESPLYRLWQDGESLNKSLLWYLVNIENLEETREKLRMAVIHFNGYARSYEEDLEQALVIGEKIGKF